MWPPDSLAKPRRGAMCEEPIDHRQVHSRFDDRRNGLARPARPEPSIHWKHALTTLTLASAFGLLMIATGVASSADEPGQHQHQHPAPSAVASDPHSMATDPRNWVKYPDALRIHTLANMRDHLLAVT